MLPGIPPLMPGKIKGDQLNFSLQHLRKVKWLGYGELEIA